MLFLTVKFTAPQIPIAFPVVPPIKVLFSIVPFSGSHWLSPECKRVIPCKKESDSFATIRFLLKIEPAFALQ